MIVQKKGRDIGREDGRVNDEDQNQPVPGGLDRRVVEQGESGQTLVGDGLVLVDVLAEGENLADFA